MESGTRSNFQRGSGCYVCKVCKKKTRETGDGESGCEMCLRCFLMSGFENTISDGGSQVADIVTFRNRFGQWPDGWCCDGDSLERAKESVMPRSEILSGANPAGDARLIADVTADAHVCKHGTDKRKTVGYLCPECEREEDELFRRELADDDIRKSGGDVCGDGSFSSTAAIRAADLAELLRCESALGFYPSD